MTAPLRKQKPDGTTYTRLPGTETLITILAQLGRDEILARCAIRQRADPLYVSSECLLHLVRASRADNSSAWFERLYKILYERVLRALPRADPAVHTICKELGRSPKSIWNYRDRAMKALKKTLGEGEDQ